MATFLMTWNRAKCPWDDLEDDIRYLEELGCLGSWSCGRRKGLRPGDRFFLLKQGTEPRGIVASGYVTSEPWEGDASFNESGWSRFVDIAFDVILDPDKDRILTREELDEKPFSSFYWNTPSSGTRIPDDLAEALELKWKSIVGNAPAVLPPDVPNQFVEGARQEIRASRFERSPKAREACLRHHGYRCMVCGMNFEETYGEIGKNFIHVHHRDPLKEHDEEHVVDPATDLCPVCPNCHAMLHRPPGECLSVEDLREKIQLLKARG